MTGQISLKKIDRARVSRMAKRSYQDKEISWNVAEIPSSGGKKDLGIDNKNGEEINIQNIFLIYQNLND